MIAVVGCRIVERGPAIVGDGDVAVPEIAVHQAGSRSIVEEHGRYAVDDSCPRLGEFSAVSVRCGALELRFEPMQGKEARPVAGLAVLLRRIADVIVAMPSKFRALIRVQFDERFGGELAVFDGAYRANPQVLENQPGVGSTAAAIYGRRDPKARRGCAALADRRPRPRSGLRHPDGRISRKTLLRTAAHNRLARGLPGIGLVRSIVNALPA